METYLQDTYYLDYQSSQVRDFVDRHIKGTNPRAQAVSLYYAVRDQILYDPYASMSGPEQMKASAVIEAGAGYCVPKALLLVACCRAVGIPAAPGFANVRNHLASKKLLAMLRTDLFVYHGYAAIWLDEQWVKATPAFNLSLCQKFDVKPLEFDGTADSLFHAFDNDGNKHMEYVVDHGIRTDMPLEEMLAAWRIAYPHWFDGSVDPSDRSQAGNLEKELEEDRS